ncbi:sialidase family protein [Streptomyces sp. NPDC051018]|uniref:sialidase family protein n=1 Tax=Streptomyces sp. NPDC051018 TaxID=3365639 RepID=UPI00379E1B43
MRIPGVVYGRTRWRAVALAAVVGALTAAGPPARGGEAGHNAAVVSGPSPFTGCPAGPLDSLLPAGAVEPYTVADPARPGRAAAVWTQDRFRGLVVGVTDDGGRSWRRTVVPGIGGCGGGRFGYADDAWLSYAPDGVLHLSAHVFDQPGTGGSGLVTARSSDGGRTWSRPVRVVTEEDPARGAFVGGAIAADPGDPRRVYAVVPRIVEPSAEGRTFGGAVVVASSRDGGRGWRAREIYDPGPGRLTTGHQLAVLRDGALVDVFTLVDMAADGPPVARLMAMRSGDRGRTWSPPVTVARMNQARVTDPQDPGVPVASGSALLGDLAADPVSGRLHVVWQDTRFPGGAAAIALSSSADGGRTWSTPRKVNRTPGSLPAGDQQAFAPSAEVTRGGTLLVSYADFRRNDSRPALLTDRWLIRCRPAADACASAGETRLTGRSFDMREAPYLSDVGPRGHFLGDYQGLTALGETALELHARPGPSGPPRVIAVRVPAPSPPEGSPGP